MTNQLDQNTAMAIALLQQRTRGFVQEYAIQPGTSFSLATMNDLAFLKAKEEEIDSNKSLSVAVRQQALSNLRQIEGIEKIHGVLAHLQSNEFDLKNSNIEQIVLAVNKKPLAVLLGSKLGSVSVPSVKEATTKAIDVTVNSINKFANFVANKTGGIK